MFKLNRIDYYFIGILIIGIILRVIALFNIDVAWDSYTYLAGSKSIIAFDYNTFRAPGFPIFIIPFLLLPRNYPLINTPESRTALVLLTNPDLLLTVKLASFTGSILLIFCSYFIFTKASIKIYNLNNNRNKNVEKNEISAKYVGLIVSCLLSLSLPFIVNSVQGLREELLSLLVIIIFYFTIIKEKMNVRDNIFLAFSMSFLTLTHLTAGIFISLGILLFFLVSKLKFFKFKSISTYKILIILFASWSSFLFWAYFCELKFGDPLFSLQVQRDFFKDAYDLDLSSLNNIIPALINGLTNGIPLEFYFLFIFNGFVFILLGLYIMVIHIKLKQFLFIFLVVGLNFAYLSIFMAVPGDIRLIIYFFPLILYLGAFPIGLILKNSNDKVSNNLNYLLVLFLSTYLFRGLKNNDQFFFLLILSS